MADARARKFDVVIVLRSGRFARSVSHLLRALEKFKALGIDFASLNESIDTFTPMGKMIFTVLAAVAELERSIITERVHAGINRARKEGKIFGRPKILVDLEKVRALHQAGESYRAIAAAIGLTK